MAKKQKSLKRSIPLIIALMFIMVLPLCTFVAIYKIGANEYYKNSEIVFKMPGTSENIVIQGLHYDEVSNNFFFCGYKNGKGPSVIYMVNYDNHSKKKINLADENGEVFSGHAGGLAVHGEYIYLAGSSKNCIYVYSYDDAINSKDGDIINCLGEYSLKTNDDKIRVSFVGIVNGKLTVGEYYVSENSYNTVSTHHVETADGEQGGLAISIDFSSSSDAIFGLSPNISHAYILPAKTQGITSSGNDIYVSTSSGLSFSKIFSYKINELVSSQKITILEQEVDLYVLDSDSQNTMRKVPPMSEEIAVVNDKMYIACESASSKYIFGLFIGARFMFATDISFFND